MSVPERLTTTISTKGQVILPKAIRRALRWEAGMRLVVENTLDGVLLKPMPIFVETRPEDVFGRLACNGAPSLWRRWRRGFWRKQSGAMRAVDTNIVV